MIARVLVGERVTFVALHLDRRTSARDVWVTVRGDRGASGEVTEMLAARMCADRLAEHIAPLADKAIQLRRACERVAHAQPFEGRRQTAVLARELEAELARVSTEIERMLDEPAGADEIDIDGEPLSLTYERATNR